MQAKANVPSDALNKKSKFQKQAEAEQMTIAEKANFGYVLVSIKSLEKYIRGAIIKKNLLQEMNQATLQGKSEIFVHRSILNDMERRLSKYNAQEEKLAKCADLNQKGISHEKEGLINLAINAYEKNIEIACPGTHSYNRLMILYRKDKRYDDEIRVIKRTIEVFSSANGPRQDGLINSLNERLIKVERLMSKKNR
jgi:tetratricopeptide (TPR) repeat protein